MDSRSQILPQCSRVSTAPVQDCQLIARRPQELKIQNKKNKYYKNELTILN